MSNICPDLKCPSLGELVDLYVGLSETSDPEALAKFLKSAEQDPEHNISVEARSGATLVGFLRAWVDQSGANGVVYDIVVSPARRSEGIAELLLAHLQIKKMR